MSERDARHPLDAERFVEGFEETVGVHAVDPDSELGRAMARAREAWGEAGPPDPADFDEDSLRGTPVAE